MALLMSIQTLPSFQTSSVHSLYDVYIFIYHTIMIYDMMDMDDQDNHSPKSPKESKKNRTSENSTKHVGD